MSKDRGIPCYFIQSGWGNVIMRLDSPQSGCGITLTLHQIVILGIQVKHIPNFNSANFKAFYGLEGVGKNVYDRIVEHDLPEIHLLESAK